MKMSHFFAPQAWLQGGWAHDVLLTVDANGAWHGIETDVPLDRRDGATLLAGPVLPGLVNAHSHAFQRAMAGLAECKGAAGSDDFWSWRDRMYSVARCITPDQLESIAALLYAELLAGGYTQVCEFHYLHNAPEGTAYASPLDMSLALVRAAERVGMGLTLLPALYMRSGFGAAGLRADQQRFASTPDSLLRLAEELRRQTAGRGRINVGLAVHSLRAADTAALKEVAATAARDALPLHLHIAEQTQEVQDCVAHTGLRPIEWLLHELPVDARWNLVHATHSTPTELRALANTGASVVICPSTEANLGDGVFDLSEYARVKGGWSIGSDSHVTRCWSEELRLLEYSQRLTLRRRNVAAHIATQSSSAAALFEAALSGGRSATGRPLGAIELGQRADFLVIDTRAPSLLGVPADHLLDALVFSSPDARYQQVFVAGQPCAVVPCAGQSDSENTRWGDLTQDFVETMTSLWS